MGDGGGGAGGRDQNRVGGARTARRGGQGCRAATAAAMEGRGGSRSINGVGVCMQRAPAPECSETPGGRGRELGELPGEITRKASERGEHGQVEHEGENGKGLRS